MRRTASGKQRGQNSVRIKKSNRHWDVLAGCEIAGADDSSIRNPIPNDMNVILERVNIKAIFATGTKAAQLYRRHCQPKTGIEVICLPSTSPANCRISTSSYMKPYSQICKYL